MAKIIGIDLGTTNCVVTVLGEIGEYRRIGGVAIITDEFGREIHASTIADVDGELVVGDDAKFLAAEGNAPATFWKRYMGKAMLYRLGDRELQPPDLSRELLLYLKGIAKNALGSVDGAIITHPAYFGADAIAATREAGDGAGLNVGKTGLMMEPIAAALAYLHDDPDLAGTVRVMVYDLGGGTFDITVLEGTGGDFTPLSFGGDPELGGYNFDKALAKHMLEHLRKQGYQITIDPDHAERDTRWACLMHLAEQAKIGLSEEAPRGLKHDINKPRVFVDDNGKSVQLRLRITREEFESMIRPMIEHTIDCCRKTLQKARLEAGHIDRAILVGGSTRVPLVQEMLEKEFGRRFEFDDEMVDLCVAIGAALCAGVAVRKTGGLQLEPLPAKVASDTLDLIVKGRLEPTEAFPNVSGAVVTLVHDEEDDLQTVGDDGAFAFDVSLTPDMENEFSLTAADPDDQVIDEARFTIEHDSGGRDEVGRGDGVSRPPTYLAKTLNVNTVNRGLVPIMEEGPPLPVDIEVDWLSTAGESDENPEVIVELFQEDQYLVEIKLDKFNAPVPQHTPLKLFVHVDQDYTMNAKAEIAAYGASAEVTDIRIPQPPKPTVEELRGHYQRLRRESKDFLDNFPPGDKKIELGSRIDGTLDEAGQLLDDPAPDVYRIQRLLRNVDRLIIPHLDGGLDPSHAEMQALFAEARQLLPQAEQKNEALKKQEWHKTLDVLQQEAEQAAARQDQRAWASVAERVNEILKRIKAILTDVPGDTPPPPVLLMMLVNHVNELESRAREENKINDPPVQKALRESRAALEGIDPTGPNAMADLARAYKGPISRLERLLDRIPEEHRPFANL
jgi:molecular chaperone DnaK (HSP70)